MARLSQWSRSKRRLPKKLNPKFDEFKFPDEEEDAASIAWRDPAWTAAAVMLERAFRSHGLTVSKMARGGLIVFVRPHCVQWVELVGRVWRDWVRDSEPSIRGTPYYGSHKAQAVGWSLWSSGSEPRSLSIDGDEAEFALAQSRGRQCVGISHDEKWLPKSLCQLADHRLELSALSPVDIGKIALDLYRRRPNAILTEAEAAAVNPDHLRLAGRPGQGANGFVERLRALVAATVVVAPHAIEPDDRKLAKAPRAAPTLDRLHGLEEAVVWGMALAEDLRAYRRGEIGLEDLDAGCLLSGPPGTGKTLFARALAATCDVPLVSGSYGQWHGSGGAHQGDLLKAMRKTFAEARKAAPCILFLDEIDSFPNRATIRHNYVEWETQVVNALLSEIDGVDRQPGVIVVGACNHPNKLDPALVRSGRLDRHIRISHPNGAALSLILREHLGEDLADASLDSLGILAVGSSGADCERYVRGARRRARQAGRPMSLEDLLAELGGAYQMDDRSLGILAIHEAGHAVTACVNKTGVIEAVTLRRDDATGGFTALTAPGGVQDAAVVRTRLVFILGGRAAEEILLGVVSAASGGPDGSDLGVATHVALAAIASCGLDEIVGLAWYGPSQQSPSGLEGVNPLVADRVREMLAEAYAEALRIIREHAGAVRAVAAALRERMVLTGEDVVDIMAAHPGEGT